MSNANEVLIRAAYAAYERADLAGMLDHIDEDLEWTYLDPAFEHPEPQVCRGRHEFQVALERQIAHGLKAHLEEVLANGDQVMVVIRTPGVDAGRARPNGDLNTDVMTVRGGKVVAIRACHDRAEALALVGQGS
ncbi:MAG TPA: nuclear transport factor 2 family protein [Candidatus Limnocylindrales bacterium]|nr:nuclear transport factor 2 family protein [Candidatus Limnocylindrales bacterium]